MRMIRSTPGAVVLAFTALLLLNDALAHPSIDVQVADLTERIARNPSDAGLFLKRGELHRIHEDRDAARTDFEKARSLDPALHLVDLAIGKLEFDLGNPGAALAAFDRYLAANPGDPGGLVLRGDALLRLGRPAAAAEAYDGAIRGRIAVGAAPSPELFIARSRARTEAGAEQRDRALAEIDEGIALLGRPITLEVEALDLEVALGRIDAAIARLDRLASSSNRPEAWFVRRGEILEKAGRSAEARRSYDAALASIETLPAGRREIRAVADLESRSRAALGRLPQTQASLGAKPNDHE